MNLFIVQPGQRTCWHRHQRQTDQFLVIRGSLRLGFVQAGAPTYARLTAETMTRFDVAPGWWHGYENIGPDPAYLLMYLDRKYDPTDEERMSEAELPWGPFCDYCQGLRPCQCGTEDDTA